MSDNMSAEWGDWVRVGRYPTLEQAYDHGLVILAMGEACRVEEAATPGEYELQAEALPAAKVCAELDAYGREIHQTSRPQPALSDRPVRSPGYLLCALWMLSLVLTFHWQGQDPSLVRRAASSSVGLYELGQWWRPFTAMFLHSDVTHLAGNLAAGLVFSTMVSRAIGPLVGWSMILGCGTIGNLITSWVAFPDPFTSIGASTAVFAALGILSGVGGAESFGDRGRMPWLRVFAPPLAGIILLGLIGGGNNPNTDVLGHIFGFGSGMIAGLVIRTVERHPS